MVKSNMPKAKGRMLQSEHRTMSLSTDHTGIELEVRASSETRHQPDVSEHLNCRTFWHLEHLVGTAHTHDGRAKYQPGEHIADDAGKGESVEAMR